MRVPLSGKRNKSKRKIILGITALLLLLLAVTAIVLLHSAAERKRTEYIQKARDSYNTGDYENALLYLRRAKSSEDDPEVLLLIADCYEAMENYPRALETLRKLNTKEPAVANRIQTIEQRKLQQARKAVVVVAGVELPENAQEAVLDGLELTDIQLQEISQLYSLDRLSLRNNLLSDLSALSKLRGLDELDVAGNQISRLEPLASLDTLRVLNLDGNPVENVLLLGSLKYLTSLSVVDTGVQEETVRELAEMLPECAIRFGETEKERILISGEVYPINLEELTLSGKNLTDISILRNFTNLKILDVSNNEISDLRAVMELSQLERLNISDNSVSDLRPLIGLPALTKLEAENNMISETNSISSVEGLTELDLSGNLIRDFSGLSRLTHLHSLEMRDTGISDADLPALYGLKSLNSLDLRDNEGLSDIAIGALRSALPGSSIATSELVYEVDFSGHRVRSDEKVIAFPAAGITDLSGLAKMTQLQELDLRSNEIESLYVFEISASRVSLCKLNLSDNRIKDIMSLHALTSIEELDLSGNQIEAVAGLGTLTSLKRLDLSGNPVSEEAVRDLRSRLPECEIVF